MPDLQPSSNQVGSSVPIPPPLSPLSQALAQGGQATHLPSQQTITALPTPSIPSAPTPAVSSASTAAPTAAAPSGMPPDLAQFIVGAEGSADDAISPKGAIGRNQIMPETAAHYGVPREKLFDRATNDYVRDRYLTDLWNKYHDEKAVKIGYNAGEGVVDKWLQSGKNDSVLPNETQKYVGDKPSKTMDISGLLGKAKQIGEEVKQNSQQELSTITQQLNRLAKLASSAPAGSKEQNEALARQEQLSEQAAAAFDKLAAHPPQYTPATVMQRLGGLGTVIAVLGGLKSRQPMTAALGAAGQAMEALNQNNYDNYKIAFDQWKTQSGLVVQSLRAHSDAINQILSNKRLSIEERNSELNALAVVTGNEFLKAKFAQGSIEAPYEMQVKLVTLAQQLEAQRENMARLNAYLGLAANRQNKAGPVKEYSITGPDGKPQSLKVEELPDGSFKDATTGEKIQLPADARPVSVGEGKQAATQVARIEGAGNETAATLANLVELPITASTGWVMGAQLHTPEQIGEAARHSFANQLTSDDVKNLLYSSQGVPRFLAQLEALGAATGLVGLSNQARSALPAVGDNGFQVLRKYGEIRQIVDRAMDTAATLPGIQKLQLDKFQQILDEVHKAVPWTVKDINALQANPSDERVVDFAKRMRASGAAERKPVDDSSYNSDKDVFKAFDRGDLTKEQAKDILIRKFGHTE